MNTITTNVRTLSTSELEELKQSDEDFVLIDVLPEESYREEHIPGSVNMPVENIASEAKDKLSEDQKIVVYCASTSCEASEDAARRLQKNGYGNVKDYAPGLKAWKNSGNSTIGSKT